MIIKIINKIRYLIKLLNKNFIYYFFLTKKYKINKWHAFNNLNNRLYKKEIIALFSNLYPENNEYLKTRDQYRAYLLVYLLIFIFYISQ